MKAAGYGPSFGNQSGTISGATSQALPLLRGFQLMIYLAILLG